MQETATTRHNSMLHVRMDSELKRKASRALASMGLPASDAVRLLFHRIVVDQAFPLELKVPNAETQAAMDEADALLKEGEPSFATSEELSSSSTASTTASDTAAPWHSSAPRCTTNSSDSTGWKPAGTHRAQDPEAHWPRNEAAGHKCDHLSAPSICFTKSRP